MKRRRKLVSDKQKKNLKAFERQTRFEETENCKNLGATNFNTFFTENISKDEEDDLD